MFDEAWESPSIVRKPLDTTLVAMIDIMFVLLLFFMTATSFSKAGVPIKPPNTSHASTISRASVEITITASGAIYLGRTQVDLTRLPESISGQFLGKTDGIAVIHPDKDVKTQLLLAVVDACKKGGAENFQIAAIQK